MERHERDRSPHARYRPNDDHDDHDVDDEDDDDVGIPGIPAICENLTQSYSYQLSSNINIKSDRN